MDMNERDVRMLSVEILKLVNDGTHSDDELGRAKIGVQEALAALRHEPKAPLGAAILKFAADGKHSMDEVEEAIRLLRTAEAKPVESC